MKPTKKMRKQLKEKEITITRKQLDQIKREATDHALDVIIGFSLLAIRDEYEFGRKRIMQFHKRFTSITEAYNENLITLPDIWQTLEEEVGIKIKEGETE